MLGADRLFGLFNRHAKLIEADQSEMLYIGGERALTRFCKNHIHQNSAAARTYVQFRVVCGGKIGTYSTERLDDDAIRSAIRKALEIAAVQEKDKEFRSLPRGREIVDSRWHDRETAAASPRWRAGVVKQIVRLAERRQAEVAGAVTTGYEEIAVCNSQGIRAYQLESLCELNLLPSRGKHTAYAYWVGTRADKMPFAELARNAIERTLVAADPIAVPPGRYDVLLEPYAVGTMMSFLGYVGFGAKAYQEGRSFMSRQKGKKVASEAITFCDDGSLLAEASDARGLPRIFDCEGVRKKKVLLIDRGVAKNVVYDSRTASRVGAQSRGRDLRHAAPTRNTGHALPAPNSYGPLPTNLVMRGGGKGAVSCAQMVQSIERGLYVTRFHYVNVVEPLATVITGMTRDGTFLIENGKLGRPIKNLRFTQSILEALKHTVAVSRETRVAEGLLGACLVPAIAVRGFNFTGVSEIP